MTLRGGTISLSRGASQHVTAKTSFIEAVRYLARISCVGLASSMHRLIGATCEDHPSL